MQGKITLEDHFATTTTLGDSQIFGSHVWSELGPRLLDFQDKRLRLMDAAGIEIMIASLNAPAIQAIADIQRAVDVAREANDVLAQQIAKRPDRFVGVAALAMQDPDSAAAEGRRSRRDTGEDLPVRDVSPWTVAVDPERLLCVPRPDHEAPAPAPDGTTDELLATTCEAPTPRACAASSH